MAGWSGGSVSFSGSNGVYFASYSAPSFTFPSGSINRSGPSEFSTSGPGPFGYSTTVSASYLVSWMFPNDQLVYEDGTTISGTSPSAPPPPTFPPSWSDTSLAGFVAGVAYSDGVSATNNPTYSVSVGSLPSGISLNTSNGAVTGTPTVAGQSYSFTLRAANGDGAVTQAFSGTVGAAPSAGKWRVWTGSTWVVGPLKVWNGSAWVDSSVKVWNGSEWVTSV